VRSLRYIPAAAALALFAPGAWAHVESAREGGDALQALVGVLLVVSAALYLTGYRRVTSSKAPPGGIRKSAAFFGAGWLTLTIALVSPLAAVTDGLFSAHMIQHELLMVVAAPLLVLGRPLAVWTWGLPGAWRAAPARIVHHSAFVGAWNPLASPLGATLVHAAAIWVWHVPRVFELSESSIGAHALQHAAFLFSALLFWWALLKPARGGRVGVGVVCLFVTMLHTGALGVLLTFSGEVWYPQATGHASHWALTPLEDQQLGGLVMWVVGGLPYVGAALALAGRWLRSPEPIDETLRAA
jgi:cytochrome c oxidase assembly factor CtaG